MSRYYPAMSSSKVWTRSALAALAFMVAGCAERPRYVVERTVADFQLAPDYRHLKPKQLELGLEHARAMLAGDDGDASVLLSMGGFHLAMGHRDSAEICYARSVDGFETQARSLPPLTTASYGTVRGRADAYVGLGASLASRGEYSGAREAFDRVTGPWLEAYPEARQEKLRLSRYSSGLAWELERKPDRARREYDAALGGSEWTRARYARACAWSAAGQLDSALADFARVARSHAPDRRMAPYHIGRIRELQADTTAALAAYEAFLDAQTAGRLPLLRAANTPSDSTSDRMIAGLERAADLRTRGLYRDAQVRIQRLRTRRAR
ncbi:MAG: hypothetical protein HOP12_01650 [Candidatus Eisenbacteria bacterium]|uniref:Tetratricopeptide repeat protein n=1 Tax=Eiseniibacteriota bacterium TaxID=2212470 RepID=A0A849SH18_UNCEI|nr:hypothetical protein [Candidatus Eisenbacteria bacterium]